MTRRYFTEYCTRVSQWRFVFDIQFLIMHNNTSGGRASYLPFRLKSTCIMRDRRDEMMDDPNLDASLHRAALRGLARINRLSFASRALYKPIRTRGLLVGEEVAREAQVVVDLDQKIRQPNAPDLIFQPCG